MTNSPIFERLRHADFGTPGDTIEKHDIGSYSVEESAGGYRVTAQADQYRDRFEEFGKEHERFVLRGTVTVLRSDGKLVAAGAIGNYKPQLIEGDTPLYDMLFEYDSRTAETRREKQYCIREIIRGLRKQEEISAGAAALLTQQLPANAP